MITIFTPTFNRLHTIKRLYKSLCNQTSFDFEWLVVDDGSVDDTNSFFKSIQENRFSVRYIYQTNGGKHRAINRGVKEAKGEWFFIIDSDDYITNNAIETLEHYLSNIKNKTNFCGVVALRVHENKEVIGTPCTYDILDTNFLEYRELYKIKGDRAEVVRTDILKKYPFPEIEGEKFCNESVVWNRIAQKYIARYINESIYICEYLPGGLTDNITKIEKNNPQSSMLFYKELASYKECSIKTKIRSSYFFWLYAFASKLKFNFKNQPSLILYIILPLFPILHSLYIIKKKNK